MVGTNDIFYKNNHAGFPSGPKITALLDPVAQASPSSACLCVDPDPAARSYDTEVAM